MTPASPPSPALPATDMPVQAPPAPVLDVAPTVQGAAQRLTASRTQLRLALRGPVAAATGDAAAPSWWTGLLALPAVRVLRDAVHNWWTQHPWHSAGNAAASAVNAALQPVARKHPWALVAAALLAGGLIAASRPWRWRARMAAGGAGALPRLLNDVLATLPVASWLVLLAALAQAMAPSAPAAAAAEPAPAPPPSPVDP